jgi:peptidoglycan-associated lipoprotein
MNKKQLIKIVGVGAIIVGLTACSSTGNKNRMGAAAGAGSSQAYALNGQDGYRKAATVFYKNPTTAPANQVYYFAFDKSAMRSKDLNALQVQINYLLAHPNAKVRLEGNTDDRGSREYNVGLGWRRDQAVARLMEQAGVKPSQIQMVSYGEENPASLGENPHAWALNRRVNFTYKTY